MIFVKMIILMRMKMSNSFTIKDSTPYGQDLKWLFYKDEYNNIYLKDLEDNREKVITHYPFSRFMGSYQMDFKINPNRDLQYIAEEYFKNYVLDEEFDVNDTSEEYKGISD